MSGPSALQHVLYEAESAYAEEVTTFATARLPVKNMIDTRGLTRGKVAPEWTVDRRNDGNGHIKGENDVTWSMSGWLPGHGSSTAGTGLSMSNLGTWLGTIIGHGALAHTAGTTADGTGTTTAPGVALASGYAPGSILPIGARGDGDGGGQFYRVLSHSASALNLANALPATLANGAVIRTSEHLYTRDTVTTMTTARYQIGTANQRYNIHGGFGESINLTGFNTGQLPMWEASMRGAAAYPTTGGAFPTATAAVLHRPGVVANGSFMLAEVGATTRTTYDVRDFQIALTLGVQADKAPGGVWPGQTIQAVRRVTDTLTGSFLVDASTASASPFWHSAWDDETKEYQLLYTCSLDDGKAIAISIQRLCLTGPRPAQLDDNRINRVPVEFTAYSGATTTTDLTSSMLVIAMS